jgi:hypothetical protein
MGEGSVLQVRSCTAQRTYEPPSQSVQNREKVEEMGPKCAGEGVSAGASGSGHCLRGGALTANVDVVPVPVVGVLAARVADQAIVAPILGAHWGCAIRAVAWAPGATAAQRRPGAPRAVLVAHAPAWQEERVVERGISQTSLQLESALCCLGSHSPPPWVWMTHLLRPVPLPC